LFRRIGKTELERTRVYQITKLHSSNGGNKDVVVVVVKKKKSSIGENEDTSLFFLRFWNICFVNQAILSSD